MIALLGQYVRIQWLQLIRMPGFVIPTIGFPALFYSLFDLNFARAHLNIAGVLMLGYVAFAIIGVTLFQFGVGIANERTTPWERYVRTLPAPVGVRFGGRIVVAAMFGLVAAGFVVLVASLATGVHYTISQWAAIGAAMLAGGAVFTIFGIAIGYWCTPKSAIPIANVFYLLLSFAGGLWIPPSELPQFARVISPFTPTRQFADLLWNAPSGLSVHALTALAVFGAGFAIVAAIGYRRDEKQRYA